MSRRNDDVKYSRRKNKKGQNGLCDRKYDIILTGKCFKLML